METTKLSRLSFSTLLLLMLLPIPTRFGTPTYVDQPESLYFPETSHSIAGKFLSYWQEYGGLMRFGYPLSIELQEQSDTDGHIYTVQYFERAELELHPELQPPNDVLLPLLGSFRYDEQHSWDAPSQKPHITPGSVLFPETGKRLGGKFLDYWQGHGGLSSYGYPISDEFTEVSSFDDRAYTVQYFERAVFELHFKNAGTPYEVLLSQLGTMRYRAMYVVQAPPVISVPVPPGISLQAYEYIREVLDFVQRTWVGRDRVDWVDLHRKTVALAARTNAQTPAQTYSALGAVISDLHDAHTIFATPVMVAGDSAAVPTSPGISASYAKRAVVDVEPGSPADEAGVHVGDTILAVNDVSIEQLDASSFFSELYGGDRVDLTLKREAEGQQSAQTAQILQFTITHGYLDPIFVPIGRRFAGDIGYIALPTTIHTGIATKYSNIVQQIIRDIDQTATCGWVVDLQQDTGGSIAFMVAGLGPILGVEGDGVLGTFIYVDGTQEKWSYRNGTYLQGAGLIDRVEIEQVVDPYELKRLMPPVAVLTSYLTGSAGEATLISFRGRPNTRTFGHATSGVPTYRSAKVMEDGAYITVASARMADRTGHVYGMNEKIQPDELIPVNRRSITQDQNSVIQAGLTWLNTQKPCSR